MADSAADCGAHIRSFASLLPRLETLLGFTPAVAEIRQRFEQVSCMHSLELTRATFNAKDRQGAPDTSRMFQLTISARSDACDTLLLLIRQALDALSARFDGNCSTRRGVKKAVSDAQYRLGELTRTLRQLHEHVSLTAMGSFRGGAGALPPLEIEACVDCGDELTVNSGRAERSCPRCARVYETHGVVFEEAQLYSQEGQRSRSGCFSPSQHYKDWITNILALEPESSLSNPKVSSDSPAEVIERLRAAAVSMNKFIDLLGVGDVRALLKAVGRTDLNQHTSLLIKKLTGRGPPIIPERRRLQGYTMFSQVLAVLPQLPQSGINRSYYPYYTTKIYDLMLDANDPCRSIFAFIHLQSMDTLKKSDEHWKFICATLGWTFRPTDPAVIRAR